MNLSQTEEISSITNQIKEYEGKLEIKSCYWYKLEMVRIQDLKIVWLESF